MSGNNRYFTKTFAYLQKKVELFHSVEQRFTDILAWVYKVGMHKKEFFFSINHMFEWYHPIKIIDYMQIHNLVYREGILNHLRTDAQTLI